MHTPIWCMILLSSSGGQAQPSSGSDLAFPRLAWVRRQVARPATDLGVLSARANEIHGIQGVIAQAQRTTAVLRCPPREDERDEANCGMTTPAGRSKKSIPCARVVATPGKGASVPSPGLRSAWPTASPVDVAKCEPRAAHWLGPARFRVGERPFGARHFRALATLALGGQIVWG